MARVGYEVSSVVPPPGTSRMVTGIGRVIEEHLARLRNNPGLNLRVVGAFAEDWNPVVTSIATERWAAHSCVPPIASLRTLRLSLRSAKLPPICSIASKSGRIEVRTPLAFAGGLCCS